MKPSGKLDEPTQAWLVLPFFNQANQLRLIKSYISGIKKLFGITALDQILLNHTHY